MGREFVSLQLRVVMMVVTAAMAAASHDYADALAKSILFFEGQRSGKLPPTQRMTWRKDSGLRDGSQAGVDLVGGYYDAGDNVKFNFPMAFSTTMLAWSVLESGKFMGSDLQHALDAIRWATDYFLKATSVPGKIFVQVGQPYADHNCWERPEDMDTPRDVYAVTDQRPGSEVSAEMAAALAASSIVFRRYDRSYAAVLRDRAIKVFKFADTFRGSYSDNLGLWVCPFYCDFGGYQDELIWGAAWLYKATRQPYYWNYVLGNLDVLETDSTNNVGFSTKIGSGNFAEFGWDTKNAGINVLVSRVVKNSTLFSNLFVLNADKFVCSLLPESPTVSVKYSPGGLLFKPGGSNLQHATGMSFLLFAYARTLTREKRVVRCGSVVATPYRLVQLAKSQVDYVLGSNPSQMSYMVGYGNKFPQRIHHRGSSLPSVDHYPQRIGCQTGAPYFMSQNSNPNFLTGAIVGGPDITDFFNDSRADFVHTEPTTYINAPLVGLLAYFNSISSS